MATVADLLNACLTRLREAANSSLAQLDSGTSGTPTATTTATFIRLLNDASASLARSVYLIPDSGSFSWASGTYSKALDTLTLTGGSGQMWRAFGVKYNATVLEEMGSDVLQSITGGLRLGSTGVPEYWARMGQDGRTISLYPVPNATQTVVVDGWILPARLTAGSDTITAFEDDELRALETRLCGELALMNADDEGLAQRGPTWLADFEAWRLDRWKALPYGDQLKVAGYTPHPSSGFGPVLPGGVTGKGR